MLPTLVFAEVFPEEIISSASLTSQAGQTLQDWADRPIETPNVSDQDDPDNVRTLAAALMFVRTGEATYAERVQRSLDRVQGSERGARILAVGREVAAYVIAADLIQLNGPAEDKFKRWLRDIQHRRFRGMSLREAHEIRPNNWGTHAGASRLAIAMYLNDRQEIERAAHVFKGWLGESDGWQGFVFGKRSWQAHWWRNFAINPEGAFLNHRSVDGVLPDDQRRGGTFRWPPPKENYVYEALQGAVLQAILLDSLGYPVWEWGDRALYRAMNWLHEQANYPAEGDDTWIPYVINHFYQVSFPVRSVTRPGKGFGFADWLYPMAQP